MEYESTRKEDYNHCKDNLIKALEGLDLMDCECGDKFCSGDEYYVDIRVEIPSCDTEIFEDAVDIGHEFVDLLVEQEENKYYNIYLKTVGRKK